MTVLVAIYSPIAAWNIPEAVVAGLRARHPRHRFLHARDEGSIRYLKVCSVDGQPVPDEAIVRGYPLDDRWVTLTEEELAGVAPVLTRSIEIREFVDLHEIDPVFFRRPYYLAPDEGAEEMYVLVREALRRSGKVGLARFVLMHREHLAVIRVLGDTLVVETLHFPEELIPEHELELPAEVRLREAEVRMAVEYIRHLARPFDPGRYRNVYRQRVLALLRRKAEGRVPPGLAPPAPPRPTPPEELAERLRQSLERARAERRAA